MKETRGGATLASYVKSFYSANHLPLEIKITREPPKREKEIIPTNELLFKMATIAKRAQGLIY